MQRILAAVLAAALVLAEAPETFAQSVARAVQTPVAGAAAPVSVALPPTAIAQVSATAVLLSGPARAARPGLTARLLAVPLARLDQFFDGRKPSPAVAQPVAFAGLALAGAGLAAHAAGTAYAVANGLSVVGPLLPIYQAARQGHANDYPVKRAVLGAAGALALGLINATVLGKPVWGIAHIFSALALLAPAFVGRAPTGAQALGFKPAGASPRRALAVMALLGLALALASGGLYALAAAWIPAWLATLSAQAVGKLLLDVQLAKAALFMAMFLPELRSFFGGKSETSFNPLFSLAYFASTLGFVLWGLQMASATPPGAIREQYLVHAARNGAESIAALIALVAVRRGKGKS